jgi:staphylococcal nuclease domain-containing protein 1
MSLLSGITALEKLMHEFSVYHKSASTPAGFAPKARELVSAKFSDGAWYRARIRRSSPIKKEAEVTFIDYGNQDTIPFNEIRPLDPRFKSLPGQAHDARLRFGLYRIAFIWQYKSWWQHYFFSFIKLVKSESEYYHEAVERFRSLCEGRKLVAIVDHKEGQLQHLRLIDPSDPLAASDSTACINADLVREGYALIDKKGCRYLAGHAMEKTLKEAVLQAKRDRAGMFEFGDVEEDDWAFSTSMTLISAHHLIYLSMRSWHTKKL